MLGQESRRDWMEGKLKGENRWIKGGEGGGEIAMRSSMVAKKMTLQLTSVQKLEDCLSILLQLSFKFKCSSVLAHTYLPNR